jgi:hypothetical protein
MEDKAKVPEKRTLKKKTLDEQIPWKELSIFLLGLVLGVVVF